MRTVLRNPARRVHLCVPVLAVALCSCMQSPQEQLHGRWYNSSNSIRFNANGSVDWNSTTGRGRGMYQFDGQSRSPSKNTPVPNLVMNLAVGERAVQRQFEVQFLGGKRLRLVNTGDRGPFNEPQVLVLKRAAADSPEELTPSGFQISAMPENRREPVPEPEATVLEPGLITAAPAGN